jgi:hypothetical protein
MISTTRSISIGNIRREDGEWRIENREKGM